MRSLWHCVWDSQDNKCREKEVTLTAISDPNLCPSFDLKTAVLLPDGVPKEIVLPLKNIPKNSNVSQIKRSFVSDFVLIEKNFEVRAHLEGI